MRRPIATMPRENDEPECAAMHAQGRAFGFRPAFFDFATCTIYLSRFLDGRLAPFHVLDGLPEEVMIIRGDCGRVVATKSSLVRGFERNGFFYTRSAASRALREWRLASPTP